MFSEGTVNLRRFLRYYVGRMKVYFNQLQATMNKGLAPVYLIVGDEPLQRMEAADMVVEAARRDGVEERRSFVVTDGFDWGQLETAAGNYGLFSERQLLDVHLMVSAAGGSDFFKRFVASLPEGVVLMVRAPKLDARQAWVKRAAAAGVMVQVYRKNLQEMKHWLRERMLQAGLKMENEVVDIVAEGTEGNMLAAAQEVTKLSLLYPDTKIRQEDALASVGDSARYNPYDLADAVVAGDAGRAVTVLDGLRAMRQPVPLVLWGVTAQVRKLAALERRISAGESTDAVLGSEWRSKRSVLKKALGRRLGARWQRLLFWCWEADKAAKGMGDNEAWDELLELALRISGARSLNRRLVYRSAEPV